MPLNAQALITEILARSLSAETEGFSLTKPLGATTVAVKPDGEPLPGSLRAEPEIEQNAAAIRLLIKQYPEMKVTYPQTLISEREEIHPDKTPYTVRKLRTDAVIQVPSEFVRQHNGIDYQELVQKDSGEQLEKLTGQICKKLRKHELRTAELYAEENDGLTMTFRINSETAESDIWMIPLSRYGFYPLLWDNEICGLAVLLSGRLGEVIPPERGTQKSISVIRDNESHCCSVTIRYSLKQD